MAFDALSAHYWEPIRPLLDRPAISDIFIDRFDCIYVRDRHGFSDTDCRWHDEAQLLSALQSIATTVNATPLDAHRPILDARLPDGSRLNAGIPPLSPCVHATIRVARPARYILADLHSFGMFSERMYQYFQEAMSYQQTFVIGGAIDSGKTTLLRALLMLVAERERVFVIEDTAELNLLLSRGVRHELTAGNTAALKMEHSLQAALRSGPDRLVVGEIRTADALLAFLECSEAGFRGGAATIHAPSAAGILSRMETMLQRKSLFSMPEPYIQLVRGNLDFVIQCRRLDGHYRVVELAELADSQLVSLARWNGEAWVGPLA